MLSALGQLSWNLVLTGLATAAVLGATIYYFILLARMAERYMRAREKREAKEAELRSLGAVLQRHRTDGSMDEAFVAEKLGVSKKDVRRWERGADDPGFDNLKALAKLYGTTAQDLLYESRQE